VTLAYEAVPQAMAWEPGGDWLAVATGTSVVELNVASGERRDLFSVPSADICALASTPDGTGLAFVHCIPFGGGEYPIPPGRLYLYTPPAP
jgi:hypothetical protein